MTARTHLTAYVQQAFLLGRSAEVLQLPDLLDYFAELVDDRRIIDSIERAVAPVPSWETKRFETILDFRFYRSLIYCMTRAIEPEVFVETGVLHGMTSAFILDAMERNGHGVLHSIDLPSYAETGPANKDGYFSVLPTGHQPGWMVDPALRPRWKLALGSSRQLLEGLLRQAGRLDMFCHDSDHTYENMWFELKQAWNHLADGGILICDNIDANAAFFDFCRFANRVPLVLPAPDACRSPRPRFAVLRR